MITVQAYSKEDFTAWNSFVAKAKNGLFMFDRGYMDYHAERFQDHSLMFFEDGELLALLPTNVVGNRIYSHQGLTFGGMLAGAAMKAQKMLVCFETLLAHMRQNNFTELLYKQIPYIYHTVPAEEDAYALFRKDAELVKIEPSCCLVSSSNIKLPKGRKAQMARARREGVTVCESCDYESFMALEEEVLLERHRAAPVHSSKEMQMLAERFPNNIKLYVAMHGNRIIAGTILYVYKQLAHTQYIAANSAAREVGALDMLLQTLIDDARAAGRHFDFGISTEQGGHVLNSGLMAHKESFGARVINHFTWTLHA